MADTQPTPTCPSVSHASTGPRLAVPTPLQEAPPVSGQDVTCFQEGLSGWEWAPCSQADSPGALSALYWAGKSNKAPSAAAGR